MPEAVLSTSALNAFYGQAHVVQDVSLRLGPECVAVMGRNGAGKTTLVRAIMGLAPPRATGDVTFDSRRILGLAAHKISRLGIGYVPQGRRLFRSLTVTEHLTLAARTRTARAPWTVARVFELFPSLGQRRAAFADQISGGERSMLAIGRALMTNPRCLLLDEPTEGLAPTIVERVAHGIRGLVADGVSVMLIEQSLRPVELASDRVYLMSAGKIVHEEPTKALVANRTTFERHLGVVLDDATGSAAQGVEYLR